MAGLRRKAKVSVAVFGAFLVTMTSVVLALNAPIPSAATATTLSAIYTSTATIRDPTLDPAGRVLAFSSNQSGNFEIWTIELSGRHLTRLTYLTGDAEFPRFSPKGSTIAFYHSDGGTGRVMLMGRDGSDLRDMPNGTDADGVFSWSPTGTAIAYERSSQGQNEVVVVDIQSGRIGFRADGSYPAWDGDGTGLAFVHGQPGAWVLSIANFTTGTIRSLFESPDRIYSPTFSKNLTSFIFVGSLSGNLSVGAVRIDGGDARDLLQPPVGGMLSHYWSLTLDPHTVPSPSPDGKQIIFNVADISGRGTLFQVIPDTDVTVTAGAFDFIYPGTVIDHLITTNPNTMGPASWSVDGKSVQFVAIGEGGEYSLSIFFYAPPKYQSPYSG